MFWKTKKTVVRLFSLTFPILFEWKVDFILQSLDVVDRQAQPSKSVSPPSLL